MKFLFVCLAALMLLSCEKSEPKATNFVLILMDDMGYGDLSCYGSDINETPNLDEMALSGFRSTAFYSAQAVCSASRAAFLTGCYPSRVSIFNAYMPNSKKGLHPAEMTIAEVLKQNDYATGIFGKWHLGDHHDFLPLQQGFDEYFGIPFSNDMWPNHPQQGSVFNFGPLPLFEGNEIIDSLDDQSELTTQITEHAIDFINRNKENPFFLYIPHPQPHVPLFVSEKYKGKSKNGLYGDVMMEIDWSVGEIMKSLRKNGIEENTMIIFTSDNGPWLSYGNHSGSSGHFREGKGTAWEGGHREPFIVKFPKKIEPGIVSTVPLYAMDVLPTIAAEAEVELPSKKIDGLDVINVLTGASQDYPHEYFYYYYKTNELHAIRYQDWKMVFPHNYRTMQGQEPGLDGIPGNYTHIDIQANELYNLKEDAEEKFNVYKDHLNVVAEIEKLAEKARTELGDNLTGRKGSEQRPAGIIQE
jgi:arylsulfatase